MRPFAVLLALWCAAACPADGGTPAQQSAASTSVAGLRIDGLLEYAGGVLSFGDASWSMSAQPYRIVALGPPALVTTIDQKLNFSTWAVTESAIAQYPATLPWLVEPPVVALVGMPAKPAGGAEGLTLLKPDGSIGWQGPNSDLLWPISGDTDSDVYVITAGSGNNAILPFGSMPSLTRLAGKTFKPRWKTTLYSEAGVAGVELYAASDAGLLLGLQYDFAAWSLLVLDPTSGTERGRAPLQGQPAAALVYPGPTAEATGAELDGTMANLTVLTADAETWQRWSFDLQTAELTVTATQPLPPARDEFPQAASSPPLPQQLLPAATGARWSIPALVNARGQVLVISAGQARWLDP